VTGDYSTGAAGMWIVNGELRILFPRSLSRASTRMLMDVVEIDRNLNSEFVAAPTLHDRRDDISGQYPSAAAARKNALSPDRGYIGVAVAVTGDCGVFLPEPHERARTLKRC